MENGKGYITDNKKLIDRTVESHMRPFVESVMMGQERTIQKINEAISMMKLASNNRLLIYVLGFIDIVTIIAISLLCIGN